MLNPALYWLMTGVMLFVLAMVVPGFVLFFFAAAAMVTTLVAWLVPTTSIALQLGLFLGISLVALLSLRGVAQKRFFAAAPSAEVETVIRHGWSSMSKRFEVRQSTGDATSREKPSIMFVHLLMIIAASLVSTSFTVGAAITRELDPAVLTFVRFTLAATIFGPLVHYRYGLSFSFSLFFRCAVISGCLVTFFVCMFVALRYTSALNTSVIFALVPSISGGYALFINGERLRRGQLLALVCGLVGVIWVIFRGDPRQLLAMEWNKGDVIFLGGCFAMGLYTPLVKLLHRGESMAAMTFWVLATGSLWLFVFTSSNLSAVAWSGVPLFAWLGVGYLAVFTTIITFFLTQYAVPYLGPTKVMAYSYLYPGLVLLIDLALGHGLPPLRVIPGVLAVLAAMFVLQGIGTNQRSFFTRCR